MHVEEGTEVSDLDRAPLIRLPIDQEVFQDAVRDEDVIEDATVATEVTSFERVGDAYVLEGAIVFAGFVRRGEGQPNSDVDADDVLAMGYGNAERGEHLHHRLPFVLRVPTQSQARGIVNVASRISAWQLETASAGWVRVVADLSIVGLSGQRGYHFQCGSQEVGDLFFDQRDGMEGTSPFQADVPVAGEVGIEDDSDRKQTSAYDALEVQLTRGQDEPDITEAVDVRQADSSDIRARTESVSQARGGVAPDLQVIRAAAPSEQSSEQSAEDRSTQKSAEDGGLKGELINLDKVFEGRTAQHDPVANREAHLPSFEVTHQVSAEELRNVDREAQTDEQFVASRSFSDHGFAATAGFVPQQLPRDAASAGVESRSNATTDADEPDETVAEAVDVRDNELRGEVGVLKSELWSFVDFNAPERYCTLRYVLVLDDENLDTVADRVGCTRSDLMRANHLSADGVTSGQALFVPDRPAIPVSSGQTG